MPQIFTTIFLLHFAVVPSSKTSLAKFLGVSYRKIKKKSV